MESVSGYDEYEKYRQIGRRLDVLRLIAMAIYLLLMARLRRYTKLIIDAHAASSLLMRGKQRTEIH
jgi:hypothetical protein